MKTYRSWFVSALFLALVLPTSAPIALGGPGGGGQGGQDPPNDAFELYGDLYVVLRDTNGVVILDKNGCVRPIYAIEPDPELPIGLTCALVPLFGDESEVFVGLDTTTSTDGEVDVCDVWDPFPYMEDPEDPDVNPLFAHLQEVHFGRLSSARSPVDVIDHGYLEAISRLNSVQPLFDTDGITKLPNIATDPAGRIHYYATNAETGETGWFTIDAPLENLGLYDRIMKFGTLLRVEYIRVDNDLMYIAEEAAPDWDRYVLADELASLHPCFGVADCTDPYDTCDPYAGEGALDVCNSQLDPTEEDVLIAASAFAGAGDKTGTFTTDAMIHVNTYLGINDLESDTYFPYGTVIVESYDRFNHFGSRPPVALLQTYPDEVACADGLNILPDYPCFFAAEVQAYDATAFRAIPHCTSWDTDFFYPAVEVDGPLIDGLFDEPLVDMGYDDQKLGAAQQIAQAAEDARAIIWYIHNWAVPEFEEP